MFSWGFSRPVATKNHSELCFFVNGFKHQGYVRVIYMPENDLFSIVLLDIFKREISRFEKVAFECIVEIINREVGRTEDYLEKIRMN